LEVPLRLRDRGLRLLSRRLGRQPLGRGLAHRRLVLGVLETGQDGAFLGEVSLLDAQVDESARDLRRDRCLGPRDDVAVRGQPARTARAAAPYRGRRDADLERAFAQPERSGGGDEGEGEDAEPDVEPAARAWGGGADRVAMDAETREI